MDNEPRDEVAESAAALGVLIPAGAADDDFFRTRFLNGMTGLGGNGEHLPVFMLDERAVQRFMRQDGLEDTIAADIERHAVVVHPQPSGVDTWKPGGSLRDRNPNPIRPAPSQQPPPDAGTSAGGAVLQIECPRRAGQVSGEVTQQPLDRAVARPAAGNPRLQRHVPIPFIHEPHPGRVV